MPVACHGRFRVDFVAVKRQIWLTAEAIYISKHSAILARTVISKHNSCDSGKEHSTILRFGKGDERNRRQDISEGISLLCTELNIISSVLCIEPTSSQFTQPAKRTNEFSNQTCVFIRPTCLTLSINKKFDATLTHDIVLVYSQIKESITANIHTDHFKNWLKYLLACNWRYLSLASFTLSKFSQFNPWVDSHATCMFIKFCFSVFLTLSLPVYQNGHVHCK